MTGWASIPLGEACSKIGSGATPRGGEKAYKASGTPLIRSLNVHFDRFRLEGLAFLDDDQAELLKGVEVRSSDVLLNITGASIGRVNLAPPAMDGARVNQHVCIIRPVAGVEPQFVRYFLASPAMQGVITDENYGVTRQALTKEMIEGFALPLPPAAEQRRIVEKIEALTARWGRAREALAALPALLDRYRAAVLAAAFRGDLTAEWREEHPHTETAEQFLVRLGMSVEDIDADELPLALPPTWRWARIASLTEVKGGLAKGKRRKAPDRLEMVPYLRVANVQRGYLDLTEVKEIEATPEEITSLLLQPGDILFNEGGDRDKLGRGWVWNGEVERCIHQNHVFRARPRSPEIDPYLISHFGNTYGRRYFFGEGTQSVNLASISLPKLRAFPVPVIPPAEQAILIQQLNAAFQRVEAFEAAWHSATDRLPTLDSAILAKAFRGELVPQDPNDEPASVLLERIRAAAGEKPRRGRRIAGTA